MSGCRSEGESRGAEEVGFYSLRAIASCDGSIGTATFGPIYGGFRYSRHLQLTHQLQRPLEAFPNPSLALPSSLATTPV